VIDGGAREIIGKSQNAENGGQRRSAAVDDKREVRS
jgi:hypothetical protein